jgi:prepilin-type N-terminal cleavage/methylation domain-containing protein
MKRAYKKKYQDGFSLVEILVAIVILAVVALGIMALLPGGYKQITNAGRSATINHLGQMQLDYLRSIPVSHNDLLAGTHPTSSFPLRPMPSGGADNAKYSVHWVVEDYTSLTNARSVEVVVGFDIFNTDGTPKSADQAIEQKRVVFPTLITQ